MQRHNLYECQGGQKLGRFLSASLKLRIAAGYARRAIRERVFVVQKHFLTTKTQRTRREYLFFNHHLDRARAGSVEEIDKSDIVCMARQGAQV